jgi:5'-nucleotidase/UDP-sugar diphosphatase
VKKKYLFLSTTLLLSFLFLYFFLFFQIDVFYTNDLHGRLDVLPKISYYVKKTGSKNYLLLDSGDFIQGTPESNFFKGQSMVEIMNNVGYTAVCLGNHEFDFSEQNVYELKQQAKFVFLGSNIYSHYGTVKPYITEYLIKEFNRIKIGIFSVLTTQTKYIVIPQNLKDVEILDELLIAQKVVNQLLYNNVDLIICLSHIGLNENKGNFVDDKVLAEKIPKISFIIGGHTHRKYEIKINKTLLVQTGANGETLGHLKLLFFKPYKKIFFYRNKFVNIKSLKDDKVIKSIVDQYVEKINKIFDEEIGELKFDLQHYRDKESPVGNLVCDIMNTIAKCDFAVTNSGGLRKSLTKGVVKYRDIYTLCPFDNTIVKVNLSGKEIKEMFEHSFSGKYGILQVSKEVKIECDLNNPVGNRVKNIKINNKPLLFDKTYSVATNNFLAAGGEGYFWFTKHNVVDTKILLREAVVSYIKENKEVSLPLSHQEQRIIIVSNLKNN